MGTWEWGAAANTWNERHIACYCNVLSSPNFCSRLCISAKKIDLIFNVPSHTCKEVETRSLCPQNSHSDTVAHGRAHG